MPGQNCVPLIPDFSTTDPILPELITNKIDIKRKM